MTSKKDQPWELSQKKTFTKWANFQLQNLAVDEQSVMFQIKNIETDLCDGVILLHLLEALSIKNGVRTALTLKYIS